MQPTIWKVEFDSPPLCVITLSDGTTYEVTGLLAHKYRLVLEALVRYEREKRWIVGAQVLDDIAEALNGR
jgi:hypothetical protein